MSQKRQHSGRCSARKRVCTEESRPAVSASSVLPHLCALEFDACRKCTDVLSALLHLKTMFVCENFEGRLPPIFFQHQLYSILTKRTLVDKQVGELRQSCEIRLFKFGCEANVFNIVFSDDYKSHVLQHCKDLDVSTGLVDRFLSVVSTCPDISLSRQKFTDLGFEESDISQLVKASLLTVRDVGSWWLAIPNAGTFVKSLLFGRKCILGYIKKSKFKEVLQEELLSRTLPKAAKLCPAYHLHDLIGADLVESVSTTSGPALRVRK